MTDDTTKTDEGTTEHSTGGHGTTGRGDGDGGATIDGANCTETLRELDLFLDDELSERTRATIRQHLDGCPDCLGAFDFHAELKQVVAAKCHNDEMPPGLLSRIELCFDTDFDGDGSIG